MTPETVFTAIAERLEKETANIGLFLDGGGDFEPWCVWEAFAACREQGWPATPRPSYAKVGLLGSRETADLLVGNDGAEQVLVEIGLIHSWSTNRWIAAIDLDTRSLLRRLPRTVASLQIVIATAPEPIEDNEVWNSWLEMTTVWTRPTEMERTLPLEAKGSILVKGWLLER